MKYLFGVLGAFFVLIMALVLITSRGRRQSTGEKPLIVSQEARAGVSAVLTTQGAVTGEDRRRAIRISVSQNERRLEILTGYEESVESSSTFPNTQLAFENFLAALERAGYSAKQRTIIKDNRGVCPFGSRYTYELREYSQDLMSRWNTSCSSKQGDFAGNGSTVRRLFQMQITDYNSLVQGVDLSGTQVPKKS